MPELFYLPLSSTTAHYAPRWPRPSCRKVARALTKATIGVTVFTIALPYHESTTERQLDRTLSAALLRPSINTTASAISTTGGAAALPFVAT